MSIPDNDDPEAPTAATRLLEQLEAHAQQEGFILCGVAPAIDSGGFHRLIQWLESGYAGEMSYLQNRLEAYRHPSGVLEGVRSLVMLAMPYASASTEKVEPGRGRIARYAWSGNDYHDVIHPKLKRLGKTITQAIPEARSRGVVDTAPLLEREIANLAGLGWQGKNTLILNQRFGSYFFLACLLTDADLPASLPQQSAHCGTCTACLDACPTDAFPKPGILDATRCISYLTIEYAGPIAMELREPIGDWLFGCDVCQEVCPWNRKPSRRHERQDADMASLELSSLFDLDDDSFRARFRKTPLWRTKRRGVLRNAAIVLGNQKAPATVAALRKGLCDREPIVRGASAWALGKINTGESITALQQRLELEQDSDVQHEIQMALESSQPPT